MKKTKTNIRGAKDSLKKMMEVVGPYLRKGKSIATPPVQRWRPADESFVVPKAGTAKTLRLPL